MLLCYVQTSDDVLSRHYEVTIGASDWLYSKGIFLIIAAKVIFLIASSNLLKFCVDLDVKRVIRYGIMAGCSENIC